MPRKKPGIEVRENADGTRTYRIRWRQGSGRAGRNLSHSFDREKEALDARNRILASGSVCYCPQHVPEGVEPTMHFGAPVPPSPVQPASEGPTFGEFARRHVAAMTGVGPGYRARFAREIELHFAPFLDRPVGALGDLEVREWIRGMESGAHPWLHGYRCAYRLADGRSKCDRGCEAQRSAATIRRLLAQLGSVLAAAQSEGMATRNPFRGHRLGRRDRDQHSEMTVLGHDEWAVLEASLPAGTMRDLCTVLVGTGLRWGEVTALAVGAIDPLSKPAPRLHVARAWQDDGANGHQLGTPKSLRSRRTVTFSGAVLEALIPHIAGKRDDELVFTTPRGLPIRHSNFYNRVWRPALERSSALAWAEPLMKRPRIHDLRHTHVSWLIAAGTPIAAISRRLGHESITTTIDRYGHMLPQIDVDVIAALDAAMPVRDR